VPDLPGCIATAKTRDDVRQMIRDAIEFHLEGMAEDNEPPPAPGYWAEELEVRRPGAPMDEARPTRSIG
jgi:predicted RNase H-like HicB family nuclease